MKYCLKYKLNKNTNSQKKKKGLIIKFRIKSISKSSHIFLSARVFIFARGRILQLEAEDM